MCYGDGGEFGLDQHLDDLGEEVVDDGVKDADRGVLRDKITQTWRKKQISVLIVRFKDYL